MSDTDVTFQAMGSSIRIALGEPVAGAAPAAERVELSREFVHDFDARLSRFRPDSELSALNRSRERVHASSQLLRDAVAAGIWAASRTEGLIDPTLLPELEEAGYRSRWAEEKQASIHCALQVAPPRAKAKPDSRRRWAEIEVDDPSGTISRPPGVAIDTGCTGKGLCADMLSADLEDYSFFIVDCGGDMRLGGFESIRAPFDVRVQHPLTGERNCVLRVVEGGVATSGIDRRIWRTEAGQYAHHILDPSTGKPAWTGLVGATALASTTVEAETLSKAALLQGPEGGRELLAQRGGILFHDSGRLEVVGPMRITPRFDAAFASFSGGNR